MGTSFSEMKMTRKKKWKIRFQNTIFHNLKFLNFLKSNHSKIFHNQVDNIQSMIISHKQQLSDMSEEIEKEYGFRDKYLAHIEEEEIISLLMKRGYIPVDIKEKGYYYFVKTL